MSYLEEGYRAAGGLDQDWTQTRFVTHGRTILNINGTLLKDGWMHKSVEEIHLLLLITSPASLRRAMKYKKGFNYLLIFKRHTATGQNNIQPATTHQCTIDLCNTSPNEDYI